jgi:rhodanese-related sulfurtransferase
VVQASYKQDSFPDISLAELKQHIKNGSVVLIDVNGSSSYAKGHIPGAVNFAEMGNEGLASALPADKNALIVAYCGGPRCSAYKRAAKVAVALGYTNVQHFSGGISGWKDAGLDVNKG